METHPPTDRPATEPRSPTQLRRRPSEGHLGGVCAGLAEYFAIDPVIVRIAAVILAVSGPGVPAYVLAWIFVPEADDDAPSSLASPAEEREDRGAQAFGIVLIAVALSVLWGGWWSPARRWLFPLGLIALGLWLVFRRTGSGRSAAPAAGTGAVPGPTDSSATTAAWTAPSTAATGPAAPTGPAAEGSAPSAADDAAAGADPTASLPAPPLGPPSPPVPPWDGSGRPDGPGPHPPEGTEARAKPGRRIVLPSVLGALLVWTGVSFLTGVSVQTGLAIALCIVGLGFVVGAFVGGSKALIVPAIVLTGALVTTTVLDLPLRGPIGQRTWVPETVDQLDGLRLSVGEATLDLTALDVPEGERLEVQSSIGIGHLVVIVPDDVALEVDGEVSIGAISLFGREDTGWGPTVDRTYDLDEYDEVLALDLEVGIGELEVVAQADRDVVSRPRGERRPR